MTVEAVAYVRVSSKAQDYKSQRAAIEQAAKARGDEVVRWYSEKLSGKTLVRPELDRLRKAARAGAAPRIYVFKLDRLTRSGIRDTLDVVEEFRSVGAELVSVCDDFSLTGNAAPVILSVMAWAAQMERLAINERIAAARRRVEAEGGRWGRPCEWDEAQAKLVRKLRREGVSLRQVAKQTGLTKSMVERVLRRAS